MIYIRTTVRTCTTLALTPTATHKALWRVQTFVPLHWPGTRQMRWRNSTAVQVCSPAPPLSFPRGGHIRFFTSFNMDRSCLQPSSINHFAHLSRLIASHNLLNHSYIACSCNCVFAENNVACYYANLRGPLFNECFLSKSSLWIRTRHSMRRLVSSDPMHVYALFTVFSWCSHASCKVLCVLLV